MLSTSKLQEQLQSSQLRISQLQSVNQPSDSRDTASLQQQLSMAINEIAHLRTSASTSATTIQSHLITIQELEQRLASPAVAQQPPVTSHTSFAQGEVAKMLEKKQVCVPVRCSRVIV